MTTRLGTRGRGRRESGTEVLEVALSVPIVLMLIFGLYSLGRAWDIYQTMTRAASEGVRQAVTTNCATCGNTSYSATDVQSLFVYPALQAAGINTSGIQNYTQGYTWLDSANSVCGAYISFQYPYKLTVPYMPVSIASITLKTDVQMRLENPPNDGTCP
ncbi:MAG TPA: TadE/TadG family type IV pilus assembly protein [Candidatus Dormibacteraeota bacterium]|nr:TadE/TadG family type IV pilus assembly protein [Candidatus Dormibacteraeota bacterium]